MKIFWAWQSDTAGNIGRFFVRDALKAAIEQLKSEAEVVEPTERETLAAMDLDHDRKGVPGSPDLARTILEKIEAASVFVADVTPIGLVPSAGGEDSRQPKRLINSNVAIEMGYALRSLGDRSLLMVMNTHYGTREDLPFDVAHKAGPIMFNLAPDADKVMIAAAAQKLKAQFFEAIKLCIADEVKEKKAQQPFDAAEPAGNAAVFFSPGTVLGATGMPGGHEFTFSHDRVAYMRIYPASGAVKVGRAKVAKVFDDRRSMPMTKGDLNSVFDKNDFGPIVFEHEGNSSISALTQGFKTGELWGMTGQLFRPFKSTSHGSGNGEMAIALPMVTFEQIYRRVLRNYAMVQAKLGLTPPYTVILGVVGLKGVYLTVPAGGVFGRGDQHGPIRENEIQRTYPLAAVVDAAIDDVLRDFFNEVYDMAHIRRADGWTDELIAAHDVPSL